MWARKQLDIDSGSILYGVLRCAFPGRPEDHRERIAGFLSREDSGLICLSVRTGFDLLLTELQLPEGSEVLMTSLTIPDMPEIVRAHGLVPVPLDLDVRTAGPDPALLEKSITRHTRAVVMAHLFGSELDMTPISEICRRRNVFVIEDSAQAFHSTDRWGHPGADASMFSFGTIKTSTALGGAVIRRFGKPSR